MKSSPIARSSSTGALVGQRNLASWAASPLQQQPRSNVVAVQDLRRGVPASARQEVRPGKPQPLQPSWRCQAAPAGSPRDTVMVHVSPCRASSPPCGQQDASGSPTRARAGSNTRGVGVVTPQPGTEPTLGQRRCISPQRATVTPQRLWAWSPKQEVQQAESGKGYAASSSLRGRASLPATQQQMGLGVPVHVSPIRCMMVQPQQQQQRVESPLRQRSMGSVGSMEVSAATAPLEANVGQCGAWPQWQRSSQAGARPVPVEAVAVRVSPIRGRPAAQPSQPLMQRHASDPGLLSVKPKVATEVHVTPVSAASRLAPGASRPSVVPASPRLRPAAPKAAAAAPVEPVARGAAQPLCAEKLQEVQRPPEVQQQEPRVELSPPSGRRDSPRPSQLEGSRSLSPSPLSMEMSLAKAASVKPGMCLAEWSAAREVAARQAQQARASPTKSRKLIRPRSRLKAIEEAAAEAAQLEASQKGKAAEESTTTVSDEEATTRGDDDEAEEASHSPAEPQDAAFSVGSATSEQTMAEALEAVSEQRTTTPPPSDRGNSPAGWMSALEKDLAGTDPDDLDVLKSLKWAAEAEVSRPEPPLVQRAGGCSLPPLGSFPLDWVNQDNHLIFELSPQRVLVAIFDGHGENAARAARRARFAFEQEAAAFKDQPLSRPAEGLRNLFSAAHSKLVQEEAFEPFAGVSCAAAVVDATTQTATIANVGDAKVIVANRWGVVEFETVQHFADPVAVAVAQGKAGFDLELLDEIGGIAACCRPPRSGTVGLWVEHALKAWKECTMGVRAVPYITPAVPLSPDSALVVLSGAVSEMIGKEAVIHSASMTGTTPEAAALSLLQQARREQSTARHPDADSGEKQPLLSSNSNFMAVIVRGGAT